MDVKNAEKLYHLLQILKGDHSFEETALIRDAFDEMYLLMHNSPELFEQLSEEEILSICTHDMKETADKFIKEQLSPGIVASFKVNDDITVYLCRGVTNLKNETVKINHPMTETTKVDLASITKLFTGLQYLKEAEEGKVDLSKKVSDYNNEFKNIDVPVEELLTFNHNIQTNGRLDQVAKNEEEAIKLLKESTIKESNTHLYSDIPYMILALMNSSFKEEFNKYFHEDLGLENTTYEIHEGDITTGGPYNHLNIVHDPKARLVSYAGHAGIFSTSEDLIKLYDALRNGWLNEESLKRIITPTLDSKYMTEDTMWLLDENGEKRLDGRGNPIPITRGMEYRHHPLGYARSEVAPSQSDRAFACSGFTGGHLSIDHIPYQNEQGKQETIWYTINTLTNPISFSYEEDGKVASKPKGYVWTLDALKSAELKAVYSVLALQAMNDKVFKKDNNEKTKVYHI